MNPSVLSRPARRSQPAPAIPVHGQRAGGGTIVAVIAGAGRLVRRAAARELRRPHPVGDVVSRRQRRGARRAAAGVGVFRLLRRRRAGDRVRFAGCRAAQPGPGVRRGRHRGGGRARAGLPLPLALRRNPGERRDAPVRVVRRHHPRPGADAPRGGAAGRSGAGDRRTPAVLRLGGRAGRRAPTGSRCEPSRSSSSSCSGSPSPRSRRSSACC